MAVRWPAKRGDVVSEANVEDALSDALAFTANNYVFNVDQTVGAGQDNYVLTYDNASGEIGLETLPAASGPTTLSTGTVTATTYGITSDGGADDVILASATGALAGLMPAAKFNEVVANNAKVTNATHTGDVTGSGALAIDPAAISGKTLVTAVATDMVLLWDATDSTLKRADVNDFLGGSSAPGGQTTEVQFNNAGAFEGADRLTFASSTAGAAFGAGSNVAGTWPTLASGTVLTAAVKGTIEHDTNCLYFTTDADNRGYVPVRNLIRADGTRTFTSNTSQQAIFNSPAGGTLTLETGTYLFKALIAMDTMSTTSGNGKFSLIGAGGATLGAILWRAHGNDLAAEATGAAVGGSWHVIATQTGVNIVTAGIPTALCFTAEGTFEVTVAGTIIPSFAQTTAEAAVVSIGSYFMCERIGTTTLTSIGQWT